MATPTLPTPIYPELPGSGWTAVEFITGDDTAVQRHVLIGQRDPAGDAVYATIAGTLHDGVTSDVSHSVEAGDAGHLREWIGQHAGARGNLTFVGCSDEQIDLTSARSCAIALDAERREQYESLQPGSQIMDIIETADINEESVTLTLEHPWHVERRRRALILVLGVLHCEVSPTLTAVDVTVPPAIARWVFDIWQAA